MNKIHTSIRLKEIMEEKELRQADLLRLALPYAEKYGERIGKNDISQYVSGKTEPGQRKLYILGKALNVNPSWLMGMDAPKTLDESTYKKNDTITDIILQLRSDDELLNMTAELCKLTPEQRAAVQSVLSAFNSSK